MMIAPCHCLSKQNLAKVNIFQESQTFKVMHDGRHGETDRQTDRRTDGRTDGRTDVPRHRDHIFCLFCFM